MDFRVVVAAAIVVLSILNLNKKFGFSNNFTIGIVIRFFCVFAALSLSCLAYVYPETFGNVNLYDESGYVKSLIVWLFPDNSVYSLSIVKRCIVLSVVMLAACIYEAIMIGKWERMEDKAIFRNLSIISIVMVVIYIYVVYNASFNLGMAENHFYSDAGFGFLNNSIDSIEQNSKCGSALFGSAMFFVASFYIGTFLAIRKKMDTK